jgi:hypothetical protein
VHCLAIPASVSDEIGFWKIIIYHDEYVLYWGALIARFQECPEISGSFVTCSATGGLSVNRVSDICPQQ